MELSDIVPVKTVKIKAFTSGAEIITKLENMGLKIGAVITVCNIAPFNTPIEVKCGNIRLAIARKQAEKIEVEYV